MARNNHVTPGSPTDLILSRLANVRKIGGGHMASCPAHGGHDCLSVSEKDGRTLVHCFSGCDTSDVLAAIDLRMSDLFADSLNPARKHEYQVRAARSARDHAKLILDIAGAQAAQSDFSEADFTALKAAHETLEAANKQLEELDAIQGEEQGPANPLLKFLSYDSDAALDKIASQQWLIDQILPIDGFGVIYGPSGAYKSFIAMDMAASVASALQWHGADIDSPGHVIYIGAESPLGLHLRKKAWEIRYQVQLKNLAILGTAVTINSALECQHLIDLCLMAADELGEPVKMIVVDTLARSFAGEENSASDMGAFVRACDHIRAKTGATVVVIHHSGKDADRGARGSSALRAACDFEYRVTSPGKKLTKVECTKAKDADPFDPIDFRLEVVEIGRNDQKGRAMTSLVLKKQDGATNQSPREDLGGHAQTLNNLIAQEMARSGQEFTTKQFIRDQFYHIMGGSKEVSRVQFHRALSKLVDDEWIIMDGEGVITRPPVF